MNFSHCENVLKEAKEKMNLKNRNQLPELFEKLKTLDLFDEFSCFTSSVLIFKNANTINVDKAIDYLKKHFKLELLEIMANKHNLKLKKVGLDYKLEKKIHLYIAINFNDLNVGHIEIVEDETGKKDINLEFISILNEFFGILDWEIQEQFELKDIDKNSIIAFRCLLGFALELKNNLKNFV